MVELKPCDCGNTLISVGKMRKDGLWHAVCLCCLRYDVIGHKTKKEAIEAWNDVRLITEIQNSNPGYMILFFKELDVVYDDPNN